MFTNLNEMHLFCFDIHIKDTTKRRLRLTSDNVKRVNHGIANCHDIIYIDIYKYVGLLSA